MRATEIKSGMILEIEGQPWEVTRFDHITPGKGKAIIHINLRNIINGSTQSQRLSSSDKVEKAFLEKRKMEYLYEDSGGFVFMDQESFEQQTLPSETLGDKMNYIKLNDTVVVFFHQGSAISIDLPPSVVLEVVETEPGLKGDTVTNVTKPAKMETGITVQVPLFINQGNTLKIDTRSGEYVERVN